MALLFHLLKVAQSVKLNGNSKQNMIWCTTSLESKQLKKMFQNVEFQGGSIQYLLFV